MAQRSYRATPSWAPRIVDTGCGTGSFLLRVGKAAPSARLIGIDPDPAVLVRARKRFTTAGLSIELHVGFARQAADLLNGRCPTKIVSSLVFHQVPMVEKQATLVAIYAALGARGELHIADYGLQRTRLMRALFRSIIQNLDGRLNTEPNARGVLPELMRGAGFRSVEETAVRGVTLFQLAQSKPERLELRLQIAPAANADAVWREAEAGLRNVLAEHGLKHVVVERGGDPPEQGRGGKFREVIPLSGART